MKVLTQGKWLWTRTIGSTIVGEFFDTIVFTCVAFGGMMPFSVLISMIFSMYLFKTLIEIVFTPITYAVIRFMKKQEGIDVYDTGYKSKDYNPFVLK
jgi:uncharacterized integral membrane protein (TIGR00697 family)